MISALFEQIATPQQLRAARTWSRCSTGPRPALNRVDRAAFFAALRASHAVQYFYEPFLEAFDPELRKELGVWYTPPEIVQYMVARVDTVLREELGIADGLADPTTSTCSTPAAAPAPTWSRCCARIDAHAAREGRRRRSGGQMVKKAAMERVFGFEILPAPFVVAHLQLGLLLQRLGAPPPADRRARRRLPHQRPHRLGAADEPKQRCRSPSWRRSATRPRSVKQEAPILVILGNPPYNGFAGMAIGRGARPVGRLPHDQDGARRRARA